MNETIGTSPAAWILLPQGNNFTVVDKNAIIRAGAPGFSSTGGTIPRGTLLIVTEKSHTNPPGRFVRVSRGRLEQDQIVVDDEIGWTAAINLAPGWSDEYGADSYADPQGPNAAWRGGVYLGQIALVNIVGTGGQAEQVTLGSLDAYLQLRQAAAENDNIAVGIESGFRSYPKQKYLYDGFRAKKPGFNRAARPGHSDHQHGQAFDLNTEKEGYDNDPVYRALKKNGPPNGFIRTVSGEPWHWEHLPEEAAQLAHAGRFKRSGIDP
jgi:hypothetical protein